VAKYVCYAACLFAMACNVTATGAFAQRALVAFAGTKGFERLDTSTGVITPLSPSSLLTSDVISNVAVDGESQTYYMLGFDSEAHGKSNSTVYLQSWNQVAGVNLVKIEDDGLLGQTCVSMHFDPVSHALVLWSWAASTTRTSQTVGVVGWLWPDGSFQLVTTSHLVAPPDTNASSMSSCHTRWNPSKGTLVALARTRTNADSVSIVYFQVRPYRGVTCHTTSPIVPGVLTGEEQISSDAAGVLFWSPEPTSADTGRSVYSLSPWPCARSVTPNRIITLPSRFRHKFGRCQTIFSDHLSIVLGPASVSAAFVVTADLRNGGIVSSAELSLSKAELLGNCVPAS